MENRISELHDSNPSHEMGLGRIRCMGSSGASIRGAPRYGIHCSKSRICRFLF